ncbi:MAG: HEPN domain-containing protein [Bacteroidales bacterium]|nr:HEPN domain-containing protein [Bacteroidales bacterium]
MSLSNEERQAVVKHRFEKSHKTFSQVQNIVPMGYWEIVANRLYYAAFYAVSALLIHKGLTAQTHHGVMHLFGLHFIKTGLVDNRFGTLYGRLFSLRQTGDYSDTFDLTEEDVTPLIIPTGELIDVIEEMISEE